jgi:hypothetical protein
MQKRGYSEVVPEVHGDVGEAPAVGLTSGYVQRALAQLPKQGRRKPWKLYQNYALDLLSLKYGSIEDGALRFTRLKNRIDEGRASACHVGGLRDGRKTCNSGGCCEEPFHILVSQMHDPSKRMTIHIDPSTLLEMLDIRFVTGIAP